jgi:hypothetical protein
MGDSKAARQLLEGSGASLLAVDSPVVGQVRPKEWRVASRPSESQEVYGNARFKGER